MAQDIVFRCGKKVLLRPFERGEIPTLRRWLNDPEITQFLMRRFPLHEKEEEEFFDMQHKRSSDVLLAIVLRENSELIGSIGLHNISLQNRTAVTGTIIGEKEHWGKGYGTDAKMLLLDFAFNALDLYAILSRVLSTNDRSAAYAKKCGYMEVGRIPQWIRHHTGVRCDEILLTVTQEAWRPLWEKYCAERDSQIP